MEKKIVNIESSKIIKYARKVIVRTGQAAIASICLAFIAEPVLACTSSGLFVPPIWVLPYGDIDMDGLNEFWVGFHVNSLFSISNTETCMAGLDVLNKPDIVFDVQEAEVGFFNEETQEIRALTDANGNPIFDFAPDPTNPLSDDFRGGLFSAEVQPFDASDPQLQPGANEQLTVLFSVEADHPTLAGSTFLFGAGSTNPAHPFEMAEATVPGSKTPEPSIAFALLALSSGALALRKKTEAS